MKKIFLGFVVLVISCFSVFASWSQGYYVDEFDDPTGEYFAYVIVNGTYSNSYTTRGQTQVRIIANVLDAKLPRVAFELEIHEDSYNTPIKEVTENSSAEYKIKFESGQIYEFTIETNDWTLWNDVYPLHGNVLAKELLNGRSLKCVIYLDDTKYNVNIPAENFGDVIQKVYDSLKPSLNVWLEKPESEFWINYMRDSYPWRKIAEYNLEYHTVSDFSPKQGFVRLIFNVQDYIDSGYPDLNVWVTLLDSYDKLDVDAKQYFASHVTFSNDKGQFEITAREEGEYKIVEWDFDKQKFQTLMEMVTSDTPIKVRVVANDLTSEFEINTNELKAVLDKMISIY